MIAAPDGAQIELDDQVVGGELNPLCDVYPAGALDGTSFLAIRCELEDGPHYVQADQPVYGYYNVGSYGYAAGSGLKRINVE